MCRMIARIGPAVTLESLLVAPEHGLLRQSWAPRHQEHGIMNADGFGVGWYDRARRAEPALYRTARPMWNDTAFAGFAGLVASTAILASVRSATPGFPVDESSTHPFTADRWLFAHNGVIDGFRDGVSESLRAALSPRAAAEIPASTDSAMLFAMTIDRLRAGTPMPDAIAEVVTLVKQAAGGRLNLLVTDGETIAATRFGASLFTATDDGVTVASEPSNDGDGWTQVPDIHVVTAAPDAGITVQPI